MTTPPTPQGYRRVETHETKLATDLIWAVSGKEWILIGDHRIGHVNEIRSNWPNIIRLVEPEAKTEINGGSNTININDLTARDWFAGQALAGLLANPHHFIDDGNSLGLFYGEEGRENEVASDNAYWYADAMMKAREAKQ